MTVGKAMLGNLTIIRTGKLDANASSEDGEYPFFTCAREPLRISNYSYDCECVLVAGNGDLNVKYYQGKFDAYQRTYIVEARPEFQDQLHLRYVYHFLEDYLVTLREQSIGGIIKYIRLGNLTSARIPLPPLADQTRIAGILDAADSLRAKRRESLAQLDTLLHSTFLDMFGDPRREGTKGRITTQPVKMGDLTRIRTGKLDANAADEDGTYPFFTCAVTTLRINKAAYDAKAVLVAGNGDLNVKYYEGKFNAYQRTYVIEAADESRLHPRFLHVFLDLYVSELRKQAIGGVIKYIKLPYLKGAVVELPDLESQCRFAAFVESIEQQKASQRAHLDALDTLFASLQSRAFRGDL